MSDTPPNKPPHTSRNVIARNTTLLSLSAVIVVLLCFMYKYQPANARFHEIAGLVLIGLLCTHFAVHFTWFTRTAKRLSHVAPKIQLRFILDVVLCLLLVVIAVTGVIISRALGFWGGNALEWTFRNYNMPALIGVHNIASWMLVPVGVVHVALNWNWLRRQLFR